MTQACLQARADDNLPWSEPRMPDCLLHKTCTARQRVNYGLHLISGDVVEPQCQFLHWCTICQGHSWNECLAMSRLDEASKRTPTDSQACALCMPCLLPASESPTYRNVFSRFLKPPCKTAALARGPDIAIRAVKQCQHLRSKQQTIGNLSTMLVYEKESINYIYVY